MMKTLLTTLALLTLSVSASAATTVTFTWTDTNITNPVCPASPTPPTPNCLVGITITRTDGTPVVISSTIAPHATTYTWTPTGGVPSGVLAFSLVVNYLDANGKAQATAAANTTVGTWPVPVPITGFTATEQ